MRAYPLTWHVVSTVTVENGYQLVRARPALRETGRPQQSPGTHVSGHVVSGPSRV